MKKQTLVFALLLAALAAGGYAQPAVLPQLPADGDTVTVDYPVFTWNALPYVPGSSYKLEIFQVLPGQTKQAAVNANPTVYSGPFSPALTLVYPVTAQPLSAPHYAWRVVSAVADNPSYGYSPVFEFFRAPDPGICPEEMTAASVPNSPLVRLTASQPHTPLPMASNTIRFYFSERHYVPDDPAQAIDFAILGNNSNVVLDNTALQPLLRHGDNFATLDLSAYVGNVLAHGQVYRLRVRDANRNLFWSKFILP